MPWNDVLGRVPLGDEGIGVGKVVRVGSFGVRPAGRTLVKADTPFWREVKLLAIFRLSAQRTFDIDAEAAMLDNNRLLTAMNKVVT
ncbi:MAG TPA: hypothetical protein VG758_04720 [Hyphomicrobiaceae bacterium]|jgi:hypothetical protein|nr:hypothetical protein [Hyphomicrobiaceae bacterium]